MEDEEETLKAAQVLGEMKQPFLTRMQSIPLVNRTVTSISSAYTSTKNSSGMLKYSAESVENLGMIITKPVLSTLEPVLRPLDRFASNQLDKVEKNFPSLRPETEVSTPPLRVEHLLNPSDQDPHQYQQQPSQQNYSEVELKDSRWRLTRLGDDTIRALRYCLSFLKYGIDTVQHQIQILGKSLLEASQGAVTILSLKQHSDGTVATTSGNIMTLITKVKREIVDTLRKVVDMLGTYSSSYLPVDARESIKSFILNLPTRLVILPSQPQGSVRPAHENSIDQEAEKVMQLATESTKMLQNIEHVISTTVSAAEYTLGRREGLDGGYLVFDVDVKRRRVRYISGASETTLSPAEQANNGMEDVEMAVI